MQTLSYAIAKKISWSIPWKLITIASILGMLLWSLIARASTDTTPSEEKFWRFQSIDTMKYSRDLSREKLHDGEFLGTINTQVKNIAETGATHVAIATPYDEEFYPILSQWVKAARRHKLNVWFRGNWSGWEKWFEYSPITRAEHIEKTREFINAHPDIFEDGDIFTPCPECENGGPGDPRQNGDAIGHRKFLIDEYEVTKEAFKSIDKNVESNFASMNGDVARLIMDKETTAAMDGIVVVDHYVPSVEKLVKDIKDLSDASGGQVVLGEFGAPIPDLHGELSEEEQADWIRDALSKLIETEELVGLNYWVNVGGSTQLWNGAHTPRQAVAVITDYFSPHRYEGVLKNDIAKPIGEASVFYRSKQVESARDGTFSLLFVEPTTVTITHTDYRTKTIYVDPNQVSETVVLSKKQETLFDHLKKLIFQLQKALNLH